MKLFVQNDSISNLQIFATSWHDIRCGVGYISHTFFFLIFWGNFFWSVCVSVCVCVCVFAIKRWKWKLLLLSYERCNITEKGISMQSACV